ncbi:MAG: heat-inducible transcriptional repressor HrcA [bacterium]
MLARALTERENTILCCVVESHVQTALPAGSRHLAKKFNLGISPATIRNVMNDLEEMGYLCQPHISAGRIPTDKGYRFYVDSLMAVRKLRRRERQIIWENLHKYAVDVKEILAAASRVLGQVSAQLGVVLEPRFYQGIFQKIELVSVSETRILAVISIMSGLVKTIMMEMESAVSRDQLEQTSWVINERLSGLSLKEVKETIDERLSDAVVSNDRLMHLVLESSYRLFSFERHEGLHLGGTHNIVANPEFSEKDDVARVLGMIESKETILHKFDQGEDNKVCVRIGRENKEDLFRDYSVIVTQYYIGNVTGALGVVGPTRMQYSRIIPLVDYVGGVLTRVFSDKLC